MSSSDRTSPGRIVSRGRAGQTATVPAARAALNGHASPPKPPADRPVSRTFRVPMASGSWLCVPDDAPGSDLSRGLHQREKAQDDDGPGSGNDPGPGGSVWVLRSRLPWVHARIIRRDGAGNQTGMDYLISAERDGPRVIVGFRQVRSGEWAGAVGIPLSDDPRISQAAGTAIRHMKPIDREYDGEREAIPRCGPDGRVTIPARETLPAGYLTAGHLPRAEALAEWRKVIVPVAVANPQFALVLGASAVSPFVGWLDYADVRAFILDLAGNPNGGKSTTVRTAGAIWGAVPKDGAGVIGSWNLSAQGPGRAMGMLGILPAIFDEQGVSGYTPDQWARIILSITDGSRRAADRESGLRVTLPYSGVVISAGNASIMTGLGAGRYAGIGPKRVSTLCGPFTGSAEQAESVKPVLRDAHGHPGMVILEKFTGAVVAALVADAARTVGTPGGVMARSAAKNMHLLTAGAAMLDQILGTGTALRDSAITAARQYLEANGHDPEHDADRVLTLLRDSMAAQPARWPTVSEYREHKLPRSYGQGGTTPAGPDHVELPQHGVDRSVAGVRADDGSWFAVVGSALEELLDRAGADRAQALGEADRRGWLHRTATDRRAGKMATFVFGVGRLHRFDLPAADDDDGQAPAGLPAPEPEPVTPEVEPGPDLCPACGSTRPLHAFDCADLPPLPLEPEPEPEPDEYGPGPESAGTAPAALASPVGTEIPARAAPAVMAPPEPPFAAVVRAYLADCAGAELDRRYHPTAEGAVKMIAHHGRSEADMIRAAFTQATEREPVAEPVAAAGRGAGRGAGDDGQDHEPDRLRAMPDDEAERAAFGRAMRKLVPDATEDDLTAALVIFHTATNGVRWVSYAGQVGQAWFAKLAAQYPSMRTPDPVASPRIREITESGPLTRCNYVARPGRQLRPGKHVTSYDLNGQHMASAGSAELGDGEPEVIESPRSLAALVSFPGYVRLAKPLRTGHPAFGIRPAGEWIAMPLAAFLIRDLGLTVPAAEVIYWPRKGRRLSVYVSRYRAARDKLMKAEQTEPVQLALAALKSQANAFVGMFHSETYSHRGFYRPDWYDQIVATAEANALRSIAKCAVPPVAKMADSAYWVSSHGPYIPEGLVISGQLGKWKLDRHGPVTDDFIAAIKDGPAHVRDAVIAIDADRRAGE